MTIDSLMKHIASELSSFYPPGEINGFIKIILGKITGLTFNEMIVNKYRELPDSTFAKLQNILESLKKFEPVQYIIAETEFFGLPFMVNPSVLIPRPETEELVDWIISENKNNSIKILDIGTGSGCIGVTLAVNLKNAEVVAMDNSPEAIDTARKNAALNNATVHYIVDDIFSAKEMNSHGPFDIIVSNPPYVLESEKMQMEENVLNYEPHQALFVPDEDPLIFYRTIASFAFNNLRSQGKIYVEINEAFGDGVADIFMNAGFRETNIRRDINGKQRMVKASL